MRFGPITLKDRNGREVVLRNAELSDAEDLIRYLKITTAETPYLIREPDEVTLTVEQEKDFLQSVIDDERSLLLIATVDGKHVGNCSLMSVGRYKRYRHRCDVAIALYQEYCGTGIGSLMLNTIFEIAKENGYEQAELEVIAENKNAIELYKKLGFVEYGRFPDNMKYADNTYVDAYWMMKKL
ncbi:MAG: GNAT family N-acetyltransferase [Lachnospiraceae bacterium]|nr:GNAT family N-acetyltransferase [Lachnospiraceae bacterium]